MCISESCNSVLRSSCFAWRLCPTFNEICFKRTVIFKLLHTLPLQVAVCLALRNSAINFVIRLMDCQCNLHSLCRVRFHELHSDSAPSMPFPSSWTGPVPLVAAVIEDHWSRGNQITPDNARAQSGNLNKLSVSDA
jgi:hypothetical protein